MLHKQVEFLGYVVSASGVAGVTKKASAATHFPRPRDLKALCTFLGLPYYYRRFVPCYSTIAQPLYTLTWNNEPFCCSDGCMEAFERLKMSLTRAPAFAYPHFDYECPLETDASGVKGGGDGMAGMAFAIPATYLPRVLCVQGVGDRECMTGLEMSLKQSSIEKYLPSTQSTQSTSAVDEEDSPSAALGVVLEQFSLNIKMTTPYGQ